MMVRRGSQGTGGPCPPMGPGGDGPSCVCPPPQGDVVNYDEIKRFIQQELSKMFDGNGAVGARAGCTPASPRPRRR